MTFKGKIFEDLTTDDFKELISTWIEFKLQEQKLMFTLNGSYSLIHTENEITLVPNKNIKLNPGQLSFLNTYERVVNNDLVPLRQMFKELNGIKF
ncbi:hypothetical protein [Chryseobacterium sp. WX]|uniref:hypothetical protein n=1 Tax=Chryseobacterium sp. WX TaxID=3031803 RepID=UPI002409F6C2|nr:hypothetical protein [Chryseobacterium sp. WX]WFB67067.1 hypothetical protein PZ898_20485 [Chryseobacterium sp. WX]